MVVALNLLFETLLRDPFLIGVIDFFSLLALRADDFDLLLLFDLIDFIDLLLDMLVLRLLPRRGVFKTDYDFFIEVLNIFFDFLDLDSDLHDFDETLDL